MQKSASFHSAHSRHVSTLTAQPTNALKLPNHSSRHTSPNSRTKIKLVSPLKDRAIQRPTQPKENYPPAAHTAPAFYTAHTHAPAIELGGKTGHTTHLPIPIKAHHPVNPLPASFVKPPEPSFKKTPQFCSQAPVMRAQSPVRMSSPPKVCINNKWFDLGALRSQVVYVTPLHQRRPVTAFPNQSCSRAEGPNGWPTELVIQEENVMEELKESYESELRHSRQSQFREEYESELREIKELHREIEDNNLQIKELLSNSRVSRSIPSSPRLPTPHEENFAPELLAETPVGSRVSQQQPHVNDKAESRVQASEGSMLSEGVQTAGENSFFRNESRCSKFSISRSRECQVQLMCSAAPKLSTPPQQEQEPEEPNSPHQLATKESRVSQATPAERSQQKIEFQEDEQDEVSQLPQQAPETTAEPPSPKLHQPEPHIERDGQLHTSAVHESRVSQKGGLTGSLLGSGKRRINNSIYL